MVSLNFNVGDNFGSIVITKHTEKQVYFKSTCSNMKETYKRVFKDEDGCEVIIIPSSVLDFFDVPKGDKFFNYVTCEKSTDTFGKDKDELYYYLRADAKKGGENVENNIKTQEVLSVEYSKALSLNRKIKANVQILADVIFELGSQLKEMRDGKLYKELGYEDFKSYCQNEIGLKQSQSYAYIKIAENIPNELFQSTGKIGVEKLKLLAKVENEQERLVLAEKTQEENLTVKQLKAEIDKLKNENAELKETVSSTNDLVVTVQNANAVLKAQNSEQVKNLNEQIEQLENQIKDLENRPVEVAVKEDTETSREISNLKREIKAREESIKRLTKQYNQLEDDMTTATQNAYKQGLDASKSNNNQDDVFEIVTENLEDAFYKYFDVVVKNKNPKWTEKIKNTLSLFDNLRGEVNYE